MPPTKKVQIQSSSRSKRARPRPRRRSAPRSVRRRSTSWSSASSSTRARRTRRWPDSSSRSSSRVYVDRTFTFITKTPPAAVLLKKAAGARQGLGHAEQEQGGHGDREAGARDRQAEDAGPERRLGRGSGQEHQGHGALDGRRCRRINRFPSSRSVPIQAESGLSVCA